MIQNTAKRIESIIPQERIMVVTNESYVSIVKEQLPKVPNENIVGEPVAKNTAPCVAIAAELLHKKIPMLPWWSCLQIIISPTPMVLSILNAAIEKQNQVSIW